MKNYTEQAKLSTVEDYCSGSAGHREIAHRHGINTNVARRWLPLDRDQLTSTSMSSNEKLLSNCDCADWQSLTRYAQKNMEKVRLGK